MTTDQKAALEKVRESLNFVSPGAIIPCDEARKTAQIPVETIQTLWESCILLDSVIKGMEPVPDMVELLNDMRCTVQYSNVATMPIPLYERMKAAIKAMGGASTRKDEGDCLKTAVDKESPAKPEPVSGTDCPACAYNKMRRYCIEVGLDPGKMLRKREPVDWNRCAKALVNSLEYAQSQEWRDAELKQHWLYYYDAVKAVLTAAGVEWKE